MPSNEHTKKLGVFSVVISLLFFAGASFFLFLYPVDSLTPFFYAIAAVLSIGGFGFLATGLQRVLSG